MTLSKDPVLSSRKSVQRLPFQQDIRQTLPQRCSYSATKQIWTWPASYSLSQSTCHWPLQTKCQEHSISGNRRWGFIQNRTSLTEVEVAVLPSRAGEKIPWALIMACFEAKVCSLQFMPSPIHLSFVLGHPQEWQREQMKGACWSTGTM